NQFRRKEGDEHGPLKKESRQTAATVRRRVAFRKTQTPSATSLTERPPKRKQFFSESKSTEVLF
ncbi:MAG: hypothetical protein J6B95_09690, partial [Oscillospiraceae bacterium]|nr:hypothetical protein [Oscillospiraceae bacterium]